MKSSNPGINTSTVEVINISGHGFWIFLNEKEYFLSYSEYPWFKNASIEKICNVKLFNAHHLHWEKLDVDLELDSIINPKDYPLIYK